MNKFILIFLIFMLVGCESQSRQKPVEKEREYKVKFIIAKSDGYFYSPRLTERKYEYGEPIPLADAAARRQIWHWATSLVEDKASKLGGKMQFNVPNRENGSELHFTCIVVDFDKEQARCVASNQQIVGFLQRSVRKIGPGYYISSDGAIEISYTTRQIKQSELDKMDADEAYRLSVFRDIAAVVSRTQH